MSWMSPTYKELKKHIGCQLSVLEEPDKLVVVCTDHNTRLYWERRPEIRIRVKPEETESHSDCEKDDCDGCDWSTF